MYFVWLGLQEGSAANPVTYNFTGGTVTDTSASSGPDVQNDVSGSDNAEVYLPNEPVHGFGTVTTTTAGGTSAPLALNELRPAWADPLDRPRSRRTPRSSGWRTTTTRRRCI